MALFIIFLIYNLLQSATLPFFIVYLLYRYFSGKNIFGSFRQRIGLVDKTKSNNNITWIHAVSVGEALSVQYFINKLKAKNPGAIIYLTVGTPAGKEMAQKNLSADYVNFMPYDFLPCILLALWRIRPNKLFIIEAEIWPNLLVLTSLFNIKKYLINARVSQRSYGRYKILKFIFAPLFNSFEKIYAQSCQDKERFVTLNVNAEKIEILGDIKTFNVYQKWLSVKNISTETKLPYTLLFVGSIHPGELDFYIKLFQSLKPNYHSLKMILAPRHFHWKNELEAKIADANLSYFSWTTQSSIKNNANESLGDALGKTFESSDLLLVCKLGEMFNLYQFADIFYLGGTFVNIGGHNLLEPAVWSRACIIGPYHQNTQAVADQMQAVGGLIKANNFDELLNGSEQLLANDNLRKQMGQKNFDWLVRQAAHVETVVDQITFF